MRRALPLLLAAACAQHRETTVTFGSTGEGLDGFLCRDSSNTMLLDRLGTDAGTASASVIVDIVGIENGQPGCRTAQLIKWCSEHTCAPMPKLRFCESVNLPTGVTGSMREDIRAKVREGLKSLSGTEVIQDAPDAFVLLRVVATRQSCDEVKGDGTVLPDLDPMQLVGCAYSCPTLFDRADEVFLGFETLTASCEQGVRICASNELVWMP
jgi:hypothetical protein